MVYTVTFSQCKSEPAKPVSQMSYKKVSENNKQEGITKDSLRYWGIDKKELLKHLKLQELAWYGGDFRDDQSKPRYEPKREDFLLTIPLVEHYLYTHGFKKPSKALFTKRIKEVFGKSLKAGELLTSLKDDISYGFANPFYAVSEKGFITYNWPLRDLITIKNNNVRLKNGVLRQILLLNKFLIYNDTDALKQLERYQYQGKTDDIGDYYNSSRMLEDLLKEYSYFGSP